MRRQAHSASKSHNSLNIILLMDIVLKKEKGIKGKVSLVI